jgi:general secretion pathway protein D
VRYPAITAENLRTLAAGADRNVRVYREDEQAIPARPQVQTPPPAAQAPPAQTPAAPAPNTAQVRFEPGNVSLKAGDTTTIGVVVDNVQDLFSIPILLQYNPAVIQVEEVRQGGFLEGGTQQIAIVQRVDQQRGQAIISATRQPNTPGVNGSGTLLGIIVRAVAPGTSTIQVLQVNARDSQQKPIPLSTGQATVTVQ